MMNSERIPAFLSVVASVGLVGSVLVAEARPQPPADVAQLVQQVLDQAQDESVRDQALDAIARLPAASDRRQATLQIIAGPPNAFAQSAAMILANDPDPPIEAMTSLAARLVVWPESLRGPIVRALEYRTPTAARKVVPRRILESVRDANTLADDPSISPLYEFAYCADVLTFPPVDPTDDVLIRLLLQRYPRATGLWLARSQLASLSAEETLAARSVMADGSAPMYLRVAAANAAAPEDADCDQFVRSPVTTLLATFGASSFNEAVVRARTDAQAAALVEGFEHDGMPVVGMFRRLRASDVQTLFISGMQVQNEPIHEAAALALARRFPAVLLGGQRGRLSDAQFVALLGMIAERQPELLAQAQQAAGSLDLEAARTAFRDKGIWGLPLQWALKFSKPY